MARQTEGPWFRRGTGGWYATVDGKAVGLGVRGESSRPEAMQAWHRLMAGGPGGTTNTPLNGPLKAVKAPEGAVSGGQGVTLRALAEAFLADAPGRMTPGCLRNYRCFLGPFTERFGGRPAEAFPPKEAEAFARRPEWSPTYRANFLTAVGAVYRWAQREGLIGSNPMVSLRKPVRESRGTSAVVTPDEHARLIAHARPDTKDLLTLLWATGARPGEVCGLTAEMVKASADGVLVLKAHKTAGKGKCRFIVLQGEAWAVALRRAEAVGCGLIFPSETGGRLTAQAVAHRLKKLCRRAGVGHRFPYGYRHSYATQALANGVPDAQVAALLGHSGTGMLHRHYSHLTAQAQALRAAAARVRA